MAMTGKKFVLDRTEAYYCPLGSLTNELAISGFHVVTPNVRLILEDFVNTTMYPHVETDADEILALRLLADSGKFAIWPVYSGTEAEVFEGYLVIMDEAAGAGQLCTLDGGVSLGLGETAPATLIADLYAYIADTVHQAIYSDPEVLPLAITTAVAKVRMAVE